MSSTSGVPLVLRILSSSFKVASRSGELVRKILSTGKLGIVEKTGIDDLQTEADRSAQRCIIASLTSQFPDVPIIGEEDLDPSEVGKEQWVETGGEPDLLEKQCPQNLGNVRPEELVIWVDPLDGTKEFTQGLLDHVTVLIGLAYQGRPIGGVIHQPFYNYQLNDPTKLGRTIWGLVGLGAHGYKDCKPLPGQNIIATTRSHSNKMVTDSIEACKPSEVVRVGGAGHKVLLVLEGQVHAYIMASPGCKKWDTCAPEAILQAAGGSLTDVNGTLHQYHSTVQHLNPFGCVATLHVDHDWYINQIPTSVKDALKQKL